MYFEAGQKKQEKGRPSGRPFFVAPSAASMGFMSVRFSDPVAETIANFLERIGIRVVLERLGEATFLPAIAIRDGALVVDPERLEWPGDMLHEAGHIAVTDPALRPTLCQVPDDPGEEMAAIAWSYAASVELGLDPAIVFHEGGYRGGARNLIENFTNGRDVGVPLLHAWDMSGPRPHRLGTGTEPYPHMLRWLR